MGIWGAIALGGLGACIGCRRCGAKFSDIADARASGILIAQGSGRWGNYFNQELFDQPTTLPWGLEIDLLHRPGGHEQDATFHPTFLYESIWDVLGVLLVFWIARKFALSNGRVLALYVMVCTVGGFWIEHMRIDFAHLFLGLLINDWTSIVLFLPVTAHFIAQRPKDGSEESDETLTG